ncbi:hypothetical protein OHS33_34210 [Streptomyces sp. NBC_00536]|uniref:hypothetical protein n=1 Tax=Streptomyces sp. NBC_00536 TaxID=2975769 RepID=UPI002E819B5E|nr:hypothetical protein [Streptomyces sp. NBC_00536]WUC82977.1 hypothetical protein OHS33_34210 [Streptomyces sp. NBC_00536]
MSTAEEGRHWPDEVSVDNARATLLQLLARAGVPSDDARHLMGLLEAGALVLAYEELSGGGRSAPGDKGEAYESGWLDGAGDLLEDLGAVTERTLLRVVGEVGRSVPAGERTRARRMEVERARVALTPLYLSFTELSELDPEVTEEVLAAVLTTMSPRQRAGYPGRLAEFSTAHRVRLERLFGAFGPGSSIAVHGRYSLVHSVTSIAVLERLVTAPQALREEWDAAELPPAWLDGLTNAWNAPA